MGEKQNDFARSQIWLAEIYDKVKQDETIMLDFMSLNKILTSV